MTIRLHVEHLDDNLVNLDGIERKIRVGDCLKECRLRSLIRRMAPSHIRRDLLRLERLPEMK